MVVVLVLLLVAGALLHGGNRPPEAPEEPITINLNVKIEHEIRVKVDKELDDLFSEDSELF